MEPWNWFLPESIPFQAVKVFVEPKFANLFSDLVLAGFQ